MTAKEPWRELRVGDRVRIVRIPTEWSKPGYYVHRDTRKLYKQLIERRRPVRVSEIDEWGIPWIQCRFRHSDGGWIYHSLAINDDSWVKVKPRKLKP